MINKAKTKKNIFSILCASLSVVFALIMGFTYCLSSLSLSYGTKPDSIDVYAGNQQFVVINDTTKNPIPFGEGSRNFEIALQYAIDYDFDVRLDYTLKWSNKGSLEYSNNENLNKNVILHFANKDNVIFDENHIFLAEGVQKGDGKLNIITGVSFVDTKDSEYYGRSLKIEVTAKIYKRFNIGNEKYDIYDEETGNYIFNNHVLTKGLQTTHAATTWIKHKMADSHIMLYNYRNNHENGVPYPGLETAYRKPTTISTSSVSGSAWLGGNKSYAGVAMFVVAGSSDLKLRVTVGAIWRYKSGQSVIDNPINSGLISENSIKLNYNSQFTHYSWSEKKLWETRDIIVSANTSCFIDVLDNIEITSANHVGGNLYDSYRAVINSISINGNDFAYTESSSQYIQTTDIVTETISQGDTTNIYNPSDTYVVNDSIYSQGLYTAYGNSVSQTFNTNISLVNNTNEPKQYEVKYRLKYFISNGNWVFTNSEDQRAEELLGNNPTEETKFNIFTTANVTYGYSVDASGLLNLPNITNREVNTGVLTNEINIDPYSCVSLVNSYDVSADLQGTILSKFDSDRLDGINNYYDVWTYLDIELVEKQIPTAEIVTEDNEIYNEQNKNITIQSSLSVVNSNTKITLYAKNNSNQTIKGLTISNVSVQERNNETYSIVEAMPKDWDATYWKYYKLIDGDYVAVTTKSISANGFPIPSDGVNDDTEEYYYSKNINFKILTTVKADGFVKDDTTNTFTSANTILLPGETIEFATAEATATNSRDVLVSGFASTNKVQDLEKLTIVNNGKDNAYIINQTNFSCYIRFTGTISENPKFQQDGGYNYYMGIVRPNQIIPVEMSSGGEIDSMVASKMLTTVAEMKTLLDSYQQVNYIESSGTQYINTGYTLSQNLKQKVEMTYCETAIGATGSLFGSMSSEGEYSIDPFALSNANYYYHWVGASDSIVGISREANVVHNTIWEANNGLLTVNQNGTEFSGEYQGVLSNNVNITLFGRSLSSGVVDELSSFRCYNFKLWDNDILVRNLVPCYRKTDNAIGMYDAVNGVFYANSGTGTFLKGNNIS